MKNILLVEPKSPDFNIFSLFKMPRLGLAILGTLAKKAGYNVKIIYQEVTQLEYKHIVWAELIGFSIITSTAPEGYRLAQLVRVINKQHGKYTPIIFGGVHATFKPEEALQYGDYVLPGKADNTFVPFLNALRDKTSLATIPALYYRKDQQIFSNPPALQHIDMDSLPTPEMALFEGYKPSFGTVMTSRGCPYNCSFCSVTAMLGRQYRMRSLELVMQDLADVTCKHVFFYDDHFTADKQRIKALCRKIITAQQEKTICVRSFSAQVRSDLVRDPELLDLMKAAGFNTLYIGFESVNPKTLKIYNKKQTPEDITFAIHEIHKRGIKIHGMFVFGSDADDKDTFKETIRFVKKNRLESVQFLILTPLPGTSYYNHLETESRIVCYEWQRFDAFNTVFLPKKMTPYDLQMMTISTMQQFYSLWRSFRFLITGKIELSFLYAFGWLSIRLWCRNNRSWLKTIKKDNHNIFIPEFMKTFCGRKIPIQ